MNEQGGSVGVHRSPTFFLRCPTRTSLRKQTKRYCGLCLNTLADITKSTKYAVLGCLVFSQAELKAMCLVGTGQKVEMVVNSTFNP